MFHGISSWVSCSCRVGSMGRPRGQERGFMFALLARCEHGTRALNVHAVFATASSVFVLCFLMSPHRRSQPHSEAASQGHAPAASPTISFASLAAALITPFAFSTTGVPP